MFARKNAAFTQQSRSKKLRVEVLEDRAVCDAVPVENWLTPDAIHGGACACPACVRNDYADGRTAWATPAAANPVGPEASAAAADLPYPGQTFALHSRPAASRTIHLDFNGHTTTGTWWNTDQNGGAAFSSSGFNFEGAADDFTVTEQDRIQRIWQRVAEDYSPFDVDVTTEDPGLARLTHTGTGDDTWGIRVVVSPDDGWARDTWGKVGGLAYVASYKTAVDTACYIFSGNLGPNSAAFIAEAVSHEVGHTLGLTHDGTAALGYYTGHAGAGTPAWAPIMGVGYNRTLVQWSKGEYANANNTQDDLAVITNPAVNFDYRPDEAGDTVAAATPAAIAGTALSFAGVIGRPSDVDVLSFQAGAGAASFQFAPWAASPNLDIRAELRNADGSFSVIADSAATLGASISATLPAAGTYYLIIDGVGAGNAATTGYSEYGSLGQYTVTGAVPAALSLAGLEAEPLTFAGAQPATAVTAGLVVAAAGVVDSATVTLGNGTPGEDQLLFTSRDGITGDFRDGVLTLTGAASAAAYQAALRSVEYRNVAGRPTPGSRTATFQVGDALGNRSEPTARALAVVAVNAAPTLDPVADMTVAEDAGDQFVNLTGITAGLGEDQAVTVTVRSSDPALIATAVEGGRVKFTPAADRSGTAVITVTVTDDGGTAFGGVNAVAQVFTVTVTPVNDAPVLTAPAAVLEPVARGSVSPRGTRIGEFVGDGLTDADADAVLGVAVTAADTAGGTWQVSADAGPTWADAGPVSETAPWLLKLDDMVRFVPRGAFVGAASFTYRAWDQTALSAAAATVTARVAPVFATLQEDAASRGGALSRLTSPLLAGPTAERGIAVVGAGGAGRGEWQFSVNAGRTWTAFGPVSFTAARLLRVADRVRFVPAPDSSGEAYLTYRAWDRSAGVAGGLASVDAGPTDHIFTQVTPVNDRPAILAAGRRLSLAPAARTPGERVSALLGTAVTDVDGSAAGVAVTAASRAGGVWEYQPAGTAAWAPFPRVSAAAALLLGPADRVRFRPTGLMKHPATFSVRAWDQTVGAAGATVNPTRGTAFSLQVGTITSPVGQ